MGGAEEVTGKWIKLHEQHLCFICGDPARPCGATDRNTDGTFAHADCLRGNSVRPAQTVVTVL